MTEPLDPRTTFLHLGVGPETSLIEVTPDFWQTIDRRTELQTGRLVTAMDMTDDWDVWEMHPAGDELIVVMDGSVRFHLDDGTHTREVVATAPEYVLVPTGTWHTADGLGPARLLVVTWGEGTTHRPR